LPDRLEVHLRSCKIPKKKPTEEVSEASTLNSSGGSGNFSTPDMRNKPIKG